VRAEIRSRTILLLSTSEGLRGAAWESYWQEWPRYFTIHLHSRIAAIGYLYCAFSAAAVVGAEAANLLAPNERRQAKVLALIAAVMSAGLLGAGIVVCQPALTLVLLVGSSFASGILRPLHQSWFNQRHESETPATMLSFQSTVANLGITAGLRAGGVVADRLGIGIAWPVCGWLWMASALCYWRLRDSRAPSRAAPIVS
jgi:predicted MFS family arabinose efflux permease